MRVSIALCTYNGALYLAEQLDSIERQTVLPDEIVICDDGSSDNTLAILKHFAGCSSILVRLFENSTNLGFTRNFEKAITLCTGDIILLSDQDDVWRHDKIERMLAAFSLHPDAGYVFTDARLIDPAGYDEGTMLWDRVGFDQACQSRFDSGKQVEVLLRRSIVTGATMGFRRTLLPLVCPIPEQWVHDGWIALLSSASSRKGVSLCEALIAYRQHQLQQIGARTVSFGTKLRKLGAGGRGMLEMERTRFEAVRTRLMDLYSENDTQTATIKEKISHLDNRLNIIEATGFTKAWAVIKEVLSGRYQKYSNSWHSMISDISQR